MFMNRRSPALIILSLILTLSVAACAPKLIPNGFVQLARAEIAFSTMRAVLPISPSTPPVKRLIIVALVNDIDFTYVRVEFENGAPFEHADRARISPDRDSIVLDLPGERRKVREVVVQYQNVRQTARRAMVEIWGDSK
jgi:hypothetical protein